MTITRTLLRSCRWRVGHHGPLASLLVAVFWMYWAALILSLLLFVAPVELFMRTRLPAGHRPVSRPVFERTGPRPPVCRYCGTQTWPGVTRCAECGAPVAA